MARRIWSIVGNSQRLDGGSMFGNAPRAVWQRWAEPDERGRIALACRALLLDDGGRKILFETGIGAFFSPKLRERYGVQETEHLLLLHLAAVGLRPEDVDVVVLSHLHFDHAGGLLRPYCEGEPPALCFPAARYVISRAAWQRATAPHLRDRASFIPELPPLLERSGRVELVDDDRSAVLGPAYRLHFSEGHTPGLMLTELPSEDGPLLFAGDLIPGTPWVHLPITMGYDRYAERLVDEKAALLQQLLERGGRLFFTHDPVTAMCRVAQDARGRFFAAEPVTEVVDQLL